MANCHYCHDEIFFAWHPEWLRWLPIEPASITGDEELTENAYGQPGVIYAKWHRRHGCKQRSWREQARAEAERRERERQQSSPRPSPPRSRPSPPPRTESWAHAALFVTSDAPIEVVRAAYKALAMLYHPDLGGDSERMVELNRAYETLLGKN